MPGEWLEAGTYGSNADVEEQFHNFLLHKSEQAYCGVELPRDLVEELKLEKTFEGAPLEVQRFMRFGRLVFGWQSSPYFALRMHARGIELVKRDPKDPTSAFCYERVELNLLGMEATTQLCRGSAAFGMHDGLSGADLLNFFNDIRPYGPNREIAVSAARQVSSGIQYHGKQDSLQKRQPVSQCPGAWAGGAIVYTDQGIIWKFISYAKWDKLRQYLDWFHDHLQSEEAMDWREFESKVGFFIHVVETYNFAKP